MPDLAQISVSDWLAVHGRGDPGLDDDPRRPAEARPEVEAALIRLGAALDAAVARDPDGLSTALRTPPLCDSLRTLMGQIGLARIFRLLGWIMEAGLPESDAVMAALVQPDAPGNGQFIQAVLSGAVQPTLLERLYAPDRLAVLLAAMKPLAALREVV
jgi:hypothetical protein